MTTHAQPTSSSAAASTHGAATLSLALLEARQLRDALKLLLHTEQSAMADFLVALADFHRRRGWERLGHANLFAFLHVELRLSKSAAFYRKSAAEVLQNFPEVIEPLREGRLCLSSIAELAKVLTEENRAVVTPRFFGLSAREAQELVAELQPREVPSTRMVVTRVLDRSVAPAACIAQPPLMLAFPSASAPPFGAAPPSGTHPSQAPPSRVLTSDFANGGGADGGGDRLATRRDEIEPLTADLRRVHFNVGTRLVKKLEAARDGLSHSIRGATMEQVLEAALDLLLEKQARARGQVKKPRASLAAKAQPRVKQQLVDTTAQRSVEKAPGITPIQLREPSPLLALVPRESPPPRRTGPREPIPAAVRRAVWERDAGRCTWPLDGGGCCGSTHRLQIDHLIPWASGGESTVANLRLICSQHNGLAARQAFGERWMGRYIGRRSKEEPGIPSS
jgi:hypothetical protein